MLQDGVHYFHVFLRANVASCSSFLVETANGSGSEAHTLQLQMLSVDPSKHVSTKMMHSHLEKKTLNMISNWLPLSLSDKPADG